MRALAALGLASTVAAGPARADSIADELREMRDALLGKAPESDDATSRARARQLLQEGERTPAAQLRMLHAAQREAAKYQVGRPQLDGTVHQAGTAWDNIGPDGDDQDQNGSNVDSGRVAKILVHPSNPDIVYVATAGGGVWKTFNANDPSGSPRWLPITEGIGSLSIGSMAMDPQNPETLLLGLGDAFDAHAVGFLHSDDGGATWSTAIALSGTLGAASVTATAVHEIAFGGSSVVLVGTNVGVFRSTERGATANWQLLDLDSAHAALDAWSVAWVGGQTWLATTKNAQNAGNVWRSTDDGATWTSVLGALPSAGADTGRMTAAVAAQDTGNPAGARVYLLAESVSGGNTKDIFRSDDGGQTWSSLGVNSSGHPSNATSNQSDLDVLHGQAWYNQMLLVDPQNRDVLFAGGNLALIRSLNGGTSWDVVTDWLPASGVNLPYVHADWHAGTMSYAGGSAVFYGGTDGGIFRSRNVNSASASSVSFEDKLNRGLVTHLIYSVGCGDARTSSSTVMLGGLQDNGTRQRRTGSANGPSTFDLVIGGDGFGVGVGRNSGGAMGSLLLGSLYGNNIRKSVNGGAFTTSTSGLPASDQNLNFYSRIATDLTDANGQTFLTFVNTAVPNTNPQQVTSQAFRTTNGATSWSNATGTVHMVDGTTNTKFPRQATQIWTNPLHAGQYAVNTAGGRAYVTTDSGANWFQTAQFYVNGTVFMGGSFAFAFDPRDATGKTVWAGSRAPTLSDNSAIPAAVGHVFRSTDQGRTWTSMAGSGATQLPNFPVNVIKLDPNDANTVYVATEIGLYRSTDGGATWARFGTGLPLVDVTDVSVALDGSAIRVATFGRGFWELYPDATNTSGVHGTGDFDGSQTIDAFDLVQIATVFQSSAADDNYTAVGNLVGNTNMIDAADVNALLAKIGGRP